MGLTHADAAAVRDALEERSAAGELVLLLNTADDPVVERMLTPRHRPDRRRGPRLRAAAGTSWW